MPVAASSPVASGLLAFQQLAFAQVPALHLRHGLLHSPPYNNRSFWLPVKTFTNIMFNFLDREKVILLAQINIHFSAISASSWPLKPAFPLLYLRKSEVSCRDLTISAVFSCLQQPWQPCYDLLNNLKSQTS